VLGCSLGSSLEGVVVVSGDHIVTQQLSGDEKGC
jgi:hypothetical protein